MAKIKKKSILQLLLFGLLIRLHLILPSSNNEVAIYTRLEQCLVILCTGVLLYRLLSSHEKSHKNAFFYIVQLFFLYVTLISIIYKADFLIPWIFIWISVEAIILSAFLYWKDQPKSSFLILSILFSFIVYLNSILVLLLPEGLYEGENGKMYYLFGNYNACGPVCLLAITVQTIYTDLTNKGKLNLFLLLIVSTITIIFLGSMTSTMGMILIGGYLCCRKLIKHTYFFIAIFAVVYILFFIMIIIQGSSIESIPIITNFLENVLGKDSSFTHRTTVWAANLIFIIQHPITGWGYIDFRIISQWSGALGTHNLILAILLYSGFIGLCLFVASLFLSLLSAKRSNTTISNLSAVALCIFLLMSLFEQYTWFIIFFFITLTYCSTYITTSSNRQNEEKKLSEHKV